MSTRHAYPPIPIGTPCDGCGKIAMSAKVLKRNGWRRAIKYTQGKKQWAVVAGRLRLRRLANGLWGKVCRNCQRLAKEVT